MRISILQFSLFIVCIFLFFINVWLQNLHSKLTNAIDDQFTKHMDFSKVQSSIDEKTKNNNVDNTPQTQKKQISKIITSLNDLPGNIIIKF